MHHLANNRFNGIITVIGGDTQVSEVIYHVSYVWEILFWIFIPLTPLGCFFDFAYSRKNETKEKTVRVEQTPFITYKAKIKPRLQVLALFFSMADLK